MSRQQYIWQEIRCPFCRGLKYTLVPVEEEKRRRGRIKTPPRKECDDCYCIRIGPEMAARYLHWRDAVCPE